MQPRALELDANAAAGPAGRAETELPWHPLQFWNPQSGNQVGTTTKERGAAAESPLYLANWAWDTIFLFFRRLLWYVVRLSRQLAIFRVSFQLFRLNRQSSTPFPLGRRHLAPRLRSGPSFRLCRSLRLPVSMVTAPSSTVLQLYGASFPSLWYGPVGSLGLLYLCGDGGRGGPQYLNRVAGAAPLLRSFLGAAPGSCAKVGFERWGSQDKSVSGLWAGECCWVVVRVSWRIFQGLKPAPLVYPVRSKIGGAGHLFSDWGSGASVWVGETDPGDRVSCVFLSFVTFRVTVPLLKTTKPSFTG